MRAISLTLMHDHVRAIHRALTGHDPVESDPLGEGREPPSISDVTRAFAELDAAARTMPLVAARVPPFSFTPPVDVIAAESETIVEVGVPGLERDDVDVSLEADRVVVWGARLYSGKPAGRVYLQAELPRGPFRREVKLPAAGARLRVEMDNGIVRIRIATPSKSSLPRA